MQHPDGRLGVFQVFGSAYFLQASFSFVDNLCADFVVIRNVVQ